MILFTNYRKYDINQQNANMIVYKYFWSITCSKESLYGKYLEKEFCNYFCFRELN